MLNATFWAIFKHCDCDYSYSNQISVVVKKNIYFSDVFGREVFLQVEIVLSLSYQVSQQVHTGAKIHICSKKSHVQNHKIHETHIFKIEFFAQFTFLKSLFLTKIWTLKIAFFTKITFHTPFFHENIIFKLTFFTKIAF